MVDNGRTEVAREYHEATKHSPASVRQSMHRLDWPNKPHLFKVYRDRPSHPLPAAVPSPTVDTLDALSTPPKGDAPLDAQRLAQVLYHAAGITKRMRTAPGEWYHFRAAACAGALYPVELYVVAGDMDGLPAGVYHFAPEAFDLTTLREGDWRSHLAAATAESAASAPASLLLSAIFWRSAWKYQARAYRYCFWDSGTILANLLATASALDLRAEVLLGFADGEVSALLGLDGEHEAVLAVVPLGQAEGPAARHEALPTLEAEVLSLSAEEADYAPIRRLHGAATLEPADVAGWRGPLRRPRLEPVEPSVHLEPGGPPSDALGAVVRRRGSTRRFRQAAIGLEDLSTVLHHATRAVPADFLEGPETSLQDIYLIVHAVEGLAAGSYHYDPVDRRLDLLREGDFRATAYFLGLEQSLPGEASATVFFLTDLERVLERYGNRGYRAVQLEAGILGGRMYLAAYALGLGATGLTFYDDEIVEFFSPHARGKETVFLMALGRPGRVDSRMEPVRGPVAAS